MSDHSHLTYAIADKADIDALSQSQRDDLYSTAHGSYDSSRVSDDGLYVVVKWKTSDGLPANMESVTHTTYSHSQILQEINVDSLSNWDNQ